MHAGVRILSSMLTVGVVVLLAGTTGRAVEHVACASPPPSGDAWLPPRYLNEPDLRVALCESGREVYRIVDHTRHHEEEAFLLRLEVRRDGQAQIIVKRSTRAFGIGATPQALLIDKSRLLSRAEFAEFRRRFDASRFWDHREFPPQAPPDTFCMSDRATTVEAVRNGRYHKISRFGFCAPLERDMQPWLATVDRLYKSLDSRERS